jgi:hypothetical protein
MALFLQRVFQAGKADRFDRCRFQFERLARCRRGQQFAGNFQGRTEREFVRCAEIGQFFAVNDLQVFETGAVVQFDECKVL